MFPFVAILHGTDKAKEDWSYNPAWFSAEDNNDNKSTADTPAKGLNTTASGDTSTAPVSFPPPVTSLLRANLSPPKASDLVQASNIPPVHSPSSQAPPDMVQPPEVSDSVQVSVANSPPMKTPYMSPAPQVSDLVKASNMPQANSPPVQALDPVHASNIPPVNLPPSTQASDLMLASSIAPPPVQAAPNMEQSLQASDSVPPVNSLPTQAANVPPITQSPPNIPPVNSLPVQASSPVQPPLVNASPEQVPPGVSPPPPNTPPALDSYCPAGTYFNKFSSPPNYVPQSSYGPVGPALGAPVGRAPQSQSTTNTIVVQLGAGTAVPTVTDFNLTNYLRNPTKYISAEDYSDAYQGAADSIFKSNKEHSLLHTITCGKFKELDPEGKVILSTVRLIYFLFQFIYPIIAAIVTKGPVAFNVVCTLFAFVGLLYDGIPICWKIWQKIRYIYLRKKSKGKSKGTSKSDVVGDNEPQPGVINPQFLPVNNSESIEQANEITTTALAAATAAGVPAATAPAAAVKYGGSSTKKMTITPKEKLREFVKEMLEEIIIYPSLICNLYSFVNDKVWEFTDVFDGFDFLLTLISFFLDAIWAKLNHMWVLYHLVKSTIDIQERNKIYSYITPFNLFVPFSAGLAIAHILMVILIAIRIYADNFNTIDLEKEPSQGNYTVAPYTRYMIFCGAYLPLMSGACYIILNKHWFLQVSWILYNDKDAPKKMHYLNITSMPTRVKLFGFLRDKYAYLAVATFAPLFIAFYTGGFLRDYNPDDLPKGALRAATVFGTLFVLVFGIINIQAGIIFTIIMILLMIMFCVICTGGGSSRNARSNLIR